MDPYGTLAIFRRPLPAHRLHVLIRSPKWKTLWSRLISAHRCRQNHYYGMWWVVKASTNLPRNGTSLETDFPHGTSSLTTPKKLNKATNLQPPKAHLQNSSTRDAQRLCCGDLLWVLCKSLDDERTKKANNASYDDNHDDWDDGIRPRFMSNALTLATPPGAICEVATHDQHRTIKGGIFGAKRANRF